MGRENGLHKVTGIAVDFCIVICRRRIIYKPFGVRQKRVAQCLTIHVRAKIGDRQSRDVAHPGVAWLRGGKVNETSRRGNGAVGIDRVAARADARV